MAIFGRGTFLKFRCFRIRVKICILLESQFKRCVVMGSLTSLAVSRISAAPTCDAEKNKKIRKKKQKWGEFKTPSCLRQAE